MRSEGFLKAERALAQHAAEVARRAPEPAELADAFAAAAPRLERALADELALLLGGDRPQVTCAKVEQVAAPQIHKMIEPVAVNWLFADAAGAELIVSLDIAGALSVTDLVFGGPGRAPAQLPERLPKSADLALAQLSGCLGTVLGAMMEREEAFGLATRCDVLGKLVRARDEEAFLSLQCAVSHDGADPFQLILLLRSSHAARLVGEGHAAAPAPRVPASRNAVSEPFSGLPLPLVAVLAELTLPVARISALKPGSTIPINIAREVPLRLQQVEIARGQAGSADGMLALRVTRSHLNKEVPNV